MTEVAAHILLLLGLRKPTLSGSCKGKINEQQYLADPVIQYKLIGTSKWAGRRHEQGASEINPA